MDPTKTATKLLEAARKLAAGEGHEPLTREELKQLSLRLLQAADTAIYERYDSELAAEPSDYKGYMVGEIDILASDLLEPQHDRDSSDNPNVGAWAKSLGLFEALTRDEYHTVVEDAVLALNKGWSSKTAASVKEQPSGPTMTKQLQKLVDDAKAAGYTVGRRGSVLRIVKRQGKKTRGICVYENGTAVDLTNAKRGMRSYRDMRSCLGLNT